MVLRLPSDELLHRILHEVPREDGAPADIWGPQNLGSGALLHGALTIHPLSQFLHHTFQHAKISTMGHLLDA